MANTCVGKKISENEKKNKQTIQGSGILTKRREDKCFNWLVGGKDANIVFWERGE